MLTKRIIPCLDIKDGRTVKGINCEQIRDAGDPVELAALYAQQGADELVFLDITATVERRKTLSELVNKIAHKINIPFTVGGYKQKKMFLYFCKMVLTKSPLIQQHLKILLLFKVLLPTSEVNVWY